MGGGFFLLIKFNFNIMALILPSLLVNQIVGSGGATTFSRNRGGNYSKVRKASANPQTMYQQNFRTIFRTIVSNWRNLDNAQRNSWNVAAPDFPYSNSLGIQKIYSGFNLYTKFNLNLVLGGFSAITNAPSPYTFSEFTEFRVSALNASQIILDFVSAGGSSDERYYVYASLQQSLGVNVVSPSTYKFIGAYQNTGSDTYDIITEYIARIGTPVANTKIFFKAVQVNIITGQEGIIRLANEIVS